MGDTSGEDEGEEGREFSHMARNLSTRSVMGITPVERGVKSDQLRRAAAVQRVNHGSLKVRYQYHAFPPLGYGITISCTLSCIAPRKSLLHQVN